MAKRKRLNKTPRDSAEAEMQISSQALKGRQSPSDPAPPTQPRIRSPGSVTRGERMITLVSQGIEMRFSPDQGRIELVGDAVSDRLAEALQVWLRSL